MEAARHSAVTVPELVSDGPIPERGAIVGRFVVLEHLGAGGMGLVVSAYDPHLDRRVALKLLRGELARGSLGHLGRSALIREAQAMARLSHPNVVNVHEIGVDATPPYVVMEQVTGRTLRVWLHERPRSWREIVDMLVEAGEGLAAAHRARIVHRDFKPENVLVGDDERPRVTDFGIAAALSTLASVSSAVAGTRGYMPPEQALGARVDARADQYAFCVTLWEALHDDPPTNGATPPNKRRAPAWLYRVLARGLSPVADERFPTMDALLATIRRRLHARKPRRAFLAAVVLLALAAFGIGRQLGHSSSEVTAGACVPQAP